MKCQYKKEYYDNELGKCLLFECEEEAVEDGLCIFHHPTYWETHKDEIREKFHKKVEESLKKGEKFLYVGYHLPNIDLARTKFTKPVYFNHATFEVVSFLGATFKKAANFRETTFKKAYFRRATFKKAYFRETTFEKVDFRNATFEAEANFRKARFEKAANFDSCVFLGTTSFVDIVFPSNFWKYNLSIKRGVTFRGVHFKKQEEVIFDNVDMSDVSFIHTDITRVKFRNVKWDEKNGGHSIYDQKLLLLKYDKKYRKKHIENAIKNIKKLKDNSGKLRKIIKENYKTSSKRKIEEITRKNIRELEEFLTENNNFNNIVDFKKFKDDWEQQLLKELSEDKDLTLDNVLSVYRSLRENYDYYLKYEESGKFFVGEMDTKRLFKKGGRTTKENVTSWMERMVLTIYRWLCLYGESYIRPIIWMFITIFAFALFRTLWAHKFYIEFPMFIVQLKLSTAIFFQMTKELDWLALFERLFSAVILGSLYISLRRKLERRIRH